MIKKNQTFKDLIDIKKLSKKFNICYRSEQDWHECYSNSEYQSYYYSKINVDFAYEIVKSRFEVSEDLSFTVKNQDTVLLVMPLFIFSEKGIVELGFIDKKIFPPLFLNGVSDKVKKELINIVFNFIKKVRDKLEIKSMNFIDNLTPDSNISSWHKIIATNQFECSLQRQAFVNLDNTMSTIKNNIRKSYKSLISKGLKIWTVKSEFSVSKEIWNDFKQLHFNAAGRKTRSDKSWDILENGLKEKELFFIYCLDSNQKMVGGSLFFLTNTESYYGIAAYNRDLFDYPIGHVIQYTAIQKFKDMGLRWYRLGKVPFVSDTHKPSVKEINIGKFKSGFSTDMFPEYCFSTKD